MKKSLRFFALCVMLVLAAGIFTACGGSGTDLSGSPYCGNWAGAKAAYSGYEFTLEELGMEFTLSLEADGKATCVFDGDAEKGKWEETANGILLKDIGDKLELTAEDGYLTLNMDGAKFYLEKQ